MSVQVVNEGKQVTVIVPKRIATGCEVKVLKCKKNTADEDCNWCIAKYSCAVFTDSPEFSLKDFVCRIETAIS